LDEGKRKEAGRMGGGNENGDMGGTRTSEGSMDSNPNPEGRWESGKREEHW
jgi:hypothetical protein